MPEEIEKLSQLAIDAALAKNWEHAVELNTQILEQDDQNISALNRISKAYIELEKYDLAKKHLKKVLEIDPINTTATRNMELAQAQKKSTTPTSTDVKNLIKEPGVSKEFNITLLSNKLNAESFFVGEQLQINEEKDGVYIVKESGEKVGSFDEATAEKIKSCINRGGTIEAVFIDGEAKNIKILVRSSLAIFKGDKQEIKPYIKRDTLEEPEIEVTLNDPEEA